MRSCSVSCTSLTHTLSSWLRLLSSSNTCVCVGATCCCCCCCCCCPSAVCGGGGSGPADVSACCSIVAGSAAGDGHRPRRWSDHAYFWMRSRSLAAPGRPSSGRLVAIAAIAAVVALSASAVAAASAGTRVTGPVPVTATAGSLARVGASALQLLPPLLSLPPQAACWPGAPFTAPSTQLGLGRVSTAATAPTTVATPAGTGGQPAADGAASLFVCAAAPEWPCWGRGEDAMVPDVVAAAAGGRVMQPAGGPAGLCTQEAGRLPPLTDGLSRRPVKPLSLRRNLSSATQVPGLDLEPPCNSVDPWFCLYAQPVGTQTSNT